MIKKFYLFLCIHTVFSQTQSSAAATYFSVTEYAKFCEDTRPIPSNKNKCDPLKNRYGAMKETEKLLLTYLPETLTTMVWNYAAYSGNKYFEFFSQYFVGDYTIPKKMSVGIAVTPERSLNQYTFACLAEAFTLIHGSSTKIKRKDDHPKTKNLLSLLKRRYSDCYFHSRRYLNNEGLTRMTIHWKDHEIGRCLQSILNFKAYVVKRGSTTHLLGLFVSELPQCAIERSLNYEELSSRINTLQTEPLSNNMYAQELQSFCKKSALFSCLKTLAELPRDIRRTYTIFITDDHTADSVIKGDCLSKAQLKEILEEC